MDATRIKALLIATLASVFGSLFADNADGGEEAASGNFLNFAIFDLPARYVADIPKENRARMMTILSRNPRDTRLDYPNNYLRWYSDGARIGATSQLWIKLLPRTVNEPGTSDPLVFVHMAKPFADGSDPAADQTFILKYHEKRWVDVTDDFLPREIDRTLHLRPFRDSDKIEVREYEKFDRADGRGQAYRFGPTRQVLAWDGQRFQVREPEPEN